MKSIIHGGLEGRVGLTDSHLPKKVHLGDKVQISGPDNSATGYVSSIDDKTIGLTTANPFCPPPGWAYNGLVPPLTTRYRLVEFTECSILEKKRD
ncbi:MAG TPA: hypothetical protein VJA23_03535 [Candidatus Nanoarchaeia archaeon]|nr:hypothetical protein [Candidatus Nanoarchaeia archaeon]